VLTEYGFDAARFPKQWIEVLHCGFRTERFLGDHGQAKKLLCTQFNWPDDSKIILFAGRMDRSIASQDPQTHKNSGFAVEIAIACAKADSQVRLIMVGTPRVGAEADLRQRVSEAGCDQNISLAGARRDIEHFMVGSNLLLFPSRGEGLGMVAVEAQAAGTPVLASTAVPKECAVIPGLVTFVPLTRSVAEWASIALDILSQPRPDATFCNGKVADSPFSIERSEMSLRDVYFGNCL
jgi:glycosyltransferase involved in cell wall biosynthesis